MKILILGSSGILGSYLCNFLKKDYKVINNGLKKRKVNLLKFNSLKKFLIKTTPDIIINCVAVTNIDDCDLYKKKAYNINYLIVKNIFFIIKKYSINSKIIQISTDQFYNNKKKKLNTENVNKINNYYCNTKYLAERLCIKNKSIVLRTNFFGLSTSNNQSFSDWVYKSFKSKNFFYLLNDVYFSPLNLSTLSNMIKKVIKNIKYTEGIFNVGSRDCISKKEFAIKFAKMCKIYKKNYKLISSKSLFSVKRPKFMCMNVQKFEKTFNVKLPSVYSQLTNEVKNYKLKK